MQLIIAASEVWQASVVRPYQRSGLLAVDQDALAVEGDVAFRTLVGRGEDPHAPWEQDLEDIGVVALLHDRSPTTDALRGTSVPNNGLLWLGSGAYSPAHSLAPLPINASMSA